MSPQNAGFIDGAESASYRPRLSRETRRLLATALVAVVTLWALARVRFPDRPAVPNPVPPILEQLTQPPTFGDLAARVGELRAQVADSLVTVVTAGHHVAALRIRDDLAVSVFTPRDAAAAAPSGVIAEDRGSGLALIQSPAATRPALPILWLPRGLDQARYLLASSAWRGDVALRPVFVASLSAVRIPQWTGDVWALPPDTGLSAGTLLFTEQAELVGIVAPHESGFAVVPARTLLAAAERLSETPQKAAADVGVEVDALTPPLSSATGAQSGVVVTWVNPTGPAASILRAGDVIQAIDDVPVTTPEQWRVMTARVGAGDRLGLKVIRRGAERTLELVASAPDDEGAPAGLGAVLRPAAGLGTEIVSVTPGTPAASAGLVAGDVVTAIGDTAAPAPARVRRTFASIRPGDAVVVAIRRGAAHRVVALQR